MCMEVWASGSRPAGMQSSAMQVRQQATNITPREKGLQVSYSRAGPRGGSGVRNPSHRGSRTGTVRGRGQVRQSPRGTVTRRDSTVQTQRRSQANRRQQRNGHYVAPATGSGVRNPYYAGRNTNTRSSRNNRGYSRGIRTNAYGVVYRDNFNHQQQHLMHQRSMNFQDINAFQSLPGQPLCYVSNPQMHQTRYGMIFEEVTCQQRRNASHRNIPAMRVCFDTTSQRVQYRAGMVNRRITCMRQRNLW